jgi:ABC-type branched-subunit amino acid transport system ATPase component/predicted MFS family arabinose efflux permease
MMEEPGAAAPDVAPPAALAQAVLDEETARTAAQARSREEIIFPDDLLPGVGSEPLTLKQGLSAGGVWMFVVLCAINALDELEVAAISVLAPDIQETFGISEGTVVFIATASATFFVLGAVPMGWLADRVRRVPIVGWSTLFFGGFVFLSGLAVNAFMLFWTRFFTGIGKANTIPVHGSLIADTYPIGVRARMNALNYGLSHTLGLLSPLLVGGIAELAGGTEGWRWAYFVLGIPVAVVGLAAFRLREPPRGQFEQQDVLGELIQDEAPAPISMEAAFARLKRIRTIRSVLVAFSALGFCIFSEQVLASLWLEDHFGVDSALRRGMLLSIAGLAALPFLPFSGRYFDRTYRENPARALAIVGALVLPLAVVTPIQFAMPNEYLFVVMAAPFAVLTTVCFSMVGPVLQAVVPYRLRGMGAALSTSYIFFFGGTGGALVAAFLTDAWSPRVAAITLAVPACLVGGLILMNSARYIRNDLSLVVQELLEEQEEHHKRRAGGERVPVLQVANLDFSYGSVQVLFDVAFEVHRGETVALLGTNGAGKSTVLRVISGLGTPDRGVVRLDGRTITYVSPEDRARLGILQLPGGKGVFPDLTVGQNLGISARLHPIGEARPGTAASLDEAARVDRVLALFPELANRRRQTAGSLSGGQQQMLALARVLIHDPEVLLIDELSLGLAPVVVQRLLEVVEQLKAAGQTMLIVEQSLNVALAVADRAIFLEKGQVRFEGPARELAERGDLVRAVFLGAEGG